MKSHNLLINIKKSTVQNQKYFVYQNKKYTINFDLLKQNCTYFYQNQNEFCDKDNINLIEEDEYGIILTEESIHSFIQPVKMNQAKLVHRQCFPFNTFRTNLKLTLDTCITSISNFGCPSLEGISIPSSVKQICDYAFNKCSSLKQITIPSSVTQIGNSVFYGCSSLEGISIPSSVTQMGNSVFSDCSSLKQVIIPSSITQIGYSFFYNCSSLKQITIPSSVTQIGNYAFGHSF